MKLLVVMPVFNEEASVRRVVEEWLPVLKEHCGDDFSILAINDGSTDGTLRILHQMEEEFDPHFVALSRANHGHGQSCLRGYEIASEMNVPWILQIDSDGQCDPKYFRLFWENRRWYGVIYGVRQQRGDGYFRLLASRLLKFWIFLATGTFCADANVPYRLMATSLVTPIIREVPHDFDLVNVLLAVLLKNSGAVHWTVPIRFRARFGGTPSVPVIKFLAKAWKLRRQLRACQRIKNLSAALNFSIHPGPL